MGINKYKLYVVALFGAIFFSFSGYYVLLMLSNNLLGVEFSRYFTIPIRIVIIILLAICLFCAGKKQHLNKPVLWAFIGFSFLYVCRVLVEILKGSSNHMSNESFLLYFLAFGFFPFLLLLLKKEYSVDYKIYRNAILLSGLLLSIFTFVFYREFIGTVGRISMAVSKDENYISPLALSYSGSLSMGVAFSLLFTHKNTLLSKLTLIGVALVSFVPFFLGASRGSVLALIIPFLLFIIYQKNKVESLRLLLLLVIISFVVVVLSEYFGSSVISRFVNIESDINEGSSSASRISTWDIALGHFYENPIFGHSLEVKETGYHPHNIFIEVLLSTGILGFLPFLYLMFAAFRNSLFIFRHVPEASWTVIVFMQCLIQNSFSGAIYSASWLWFSLYFVLSHDMISKHLNSDAATEISLESRKSLVAR